MQRQAFPDSICRMQKSVYRILAVISALMQNETDAVILGKPVLSADVGTVRLSVEHITPRHESDPRYNSTGVCSAAVLGTDPLTLLTAAHCLRDAKRQGPHNLPAVAVQLQAEKPVKGLKIRAVISPEPGIVDKNLAEDLAILVFQQRGSEPLKALKTWPIRAATPPVTVYICGFGQASKEADAQSPRCANKEVGAHPGLLPICA